MPLVHASRASTWAVLACGVFGLGGALVAAKAVVRAAEDSDTPPRTQATAATAIPAGAEKQDLLQGPAGKQMNADDQAALRSALSDELHAGAPAARAGVSKVGTGGTLPQEMPESDLDKYRSAREKVEQSLRGQRPTEDDRALLGADPGQLPVPTREQVVSNINAALTTGKLDPIH
jgi:hypothetical protein